MAFAMKFNIYGRYDLEVIRKDGGWVVYRVDNGKRRPEDSLIVPSHVAAEDVELDAQSAKVGDLPRVVVRGQLLDAALGHGSLRRRVRLGVLPGHVLEQVDQSRGAGDVASAGGR